MSTVAKLAPIQTAGADVLCVDLDKSLVASDLVWECIIALLRKKPLCVLLLPFWFARGIAYGKRQVAMAAQLDPAFLPYRSEVLDYLRDQKVLGRKLVLASAADETIARAVADHLGLFENICASDGTVNLKGKARAGRLVAIFGEGGYSYLGEATDDIEIWKRAATVLIASPSRSLQKRLTQLATPIEREFEVRRVRWRLLLRSLRLHHWAKNLLIFLPMALGHAISGQRLASAAAAFLLFGLAASSMYLLNDLLDLKSDRRHPWKSKRPLASGELPIVVGFGAFCLLFLASLALGAVILGRDFALISAAYCLLVTLYSLHLKKEPLLDVFVVSSFYVFRIVLGGIVTSVPLSTWFLVYSGFFFFSMALAKRYSELIHAHELVTRGNSGRGYRTADRDVIAILGIGAALSSVVIFCLYVESRDVVSLYPNSEPLLVIAPVLLYWMTRMWLRAHRGELQDDPLTLALKDPSSYVMAAVILVVILLSMMKK